MSATIPCLAGARCGATLLLLAIAGTHARPTVAASLAPAPPSLCSASERIVFACASANGKVISLCGTHDLGELRGTLEYRFGSVGKTPELTYPATPQRAKAAFLSGTIPYSGGGAAYLAFQIGDVRYTVFTGLGRGWEKEGVVVHRGGKQVAYLACRGEWSSELGPDLFERLRIPADPDAANFEIP